METKEKIFVGTCPCCRRKYTVEESNCLTNVHGEKYIVCNNISDVWIFGRIVQKECNTGLLLNAAKEESAD